MTLKIDEIDEKTGAWFFSHLRYLTGLSQEKAADLLELNPATIGKYENGLVSPPLNAVLLLIKQISGEIIIQYEVKS